MASVLPPDGWKPMRATTLYRVLLSRRRSVAETPEHARLQAEAEAALGRLVEALGPLDEDTLIRAAQEANPSLAD